MSFKSCSLQQDSYGKYQYSLFKNIFQTREISPTENFSLENAGAEEFPPFGISRMNLVIVKLSLKHRWLITVNFTVKLVS